MCVINEFYADKLNVKTFETRQTMGESAAADVALGIADLLKVKPETNIIFAAAPSQNEFLAALVKHDEIQWNRINAFHMDEYIGLEEDAPQAFGNFLRERIFGKVPFKSVNYIRRDEKDSHSECARYTKLLKVNPTDVVCMGIGENGHIAFNDPHVAFFDDKETVKVVELDEKCRQQQVNDGCFSVLDNVPTHSITLTIPALVSGKHIYCIVPGKTKAEAVKRTITGEITETCPATILRKHDHAFLYIDTESASLLANGTVVIGRM